MTERLRSTSTHLLAMTSRWFAAPKAIGPVESLARLLSDPIYRLEAMLESYAEISAPAGATSIPVQATARTSASLPRQRSSTVVPRPTVVVPNEISEARIVKHAREVPSSPSITSPLVRQGAPANLMPLHVVRTAKAELRPTGKRKVHTRAAGQETSSNGAAAAPDKMSREELESAPRAAQTVTRMALGGPGITSLLGSNVGRTSRNIPLGAQRTAVTAPGQIERWDQQGESWPPAEMSAPGGSHVQDFQLRSNETARLPASATVHETLRLRASAALQETPQLAAPATESETSRLAEIHGSAAVNYDELLDEFERRLAVEYLRHYGTSGV